MPRVISLILGGGRGTRLYPLTKSRSKPAVPIAGKYRLIDIPVSNCIHAGLTRIFVLIIGASDPTVLRTAAESGRILISHDRATMPAHFARFLLSQASPGLIIVSQELDVGAAIEDLLIIWAASDAAEWRNQLGFVPL